METRNKKSENVLLAIVIFLLVISFFYLRGIQVITKQQHLILPESFVQPYAHALILRPEALEAQAAYVYDLEHRRVLYEKNGDAVLPIASLTKLITALVAHEILAPADEVRILDTAVQQAGDTGLRIGERYRADELIRLMLVGSSNDAAFALAQTAGERLDEDNPIGAFVARMNQKAAELGMTSTTFVTPSGLEDTVTTASGGVSSVRDLAQVMHVILSEYPTLLTDTASQSITIAPLNGLPRNVENTNLPISHIPGLLMSKTGYTDQAGGSLVAILNRGIYHPLLFIVLGSSFSGRFQDVELLHRSIQMYD